VLAGYVSSDLIHQNLRVVVPGQAYRSGQMNAEQFTRAIEHYGIKSILNLRGENPGTAWHQAEITTAAKLNVIHYDRSLGSGTPLTLAQMDELVTLLRQAPKPILIHCNGGADRSGLVSALYLLAIEGQTSGAADQELSLWNGHVPLIRPKVTAMDNSFWLYASNHVAGAGLNLSSKPISP
jgi:protein tyrosine/serine phosphatase